MSVRLVRQFLDLASYVIKKDGSSFPLREEKSSQTSQNTILETILGGEVFYLYLRDVGQSRMVAGMSSFLKSDHGRDMQGTLSYLAFSAD